MHNTTHSDYSVTSKDHLYMDLKNGVCSCSTVSRCYESSYDMFIAPLRHLNFTLSFSSPHMSQTFSAREDKRGFGNKWVSYTLDQTVMRFSKDYKSINVIEHAFL